MALEQFDLQDYGQNSSYLQSLNFLNIHESTPPSVRSGVATANAAVNPDVGMQAQVIDFSAPLYPTEAAPFDDPEQAAKPVEKNEPAQIARPINKYEATVTEQVVGLDSEAQFTTFTKDALNRDAGRFPPVRNEKDGTTIYTIEQFGLTDRELSNGRNSAEPYKRLVTITVPDKAGSLKD